MARRIYDSLPMFHDPSPLFPFLDSEEAVLPGGLGEGCGQGLVL